MGVARDPHRRCIYYDYELQREILYVFLILLIDVIIIQFIIICNNLFHLQVALDTSYWNVIVHLFIWGSILSWLVVPPFLSNFLPLYDVGLATYYGVANEVLASAMFWWYLILVTFIALAPTFLSRVLKYELKPTLLEDVKLLETKKFNEELLEKFKKQFSRETEAEQKPIVPKLWRTGYAFAHEEGFGQLISSGHYLGALATEVEQERTKRRSTWMSEDYKSAGYRKPKATKNAASKDNKKNPSLVEASLTTGLAAGLTVALAGGRKKEETDPVTSAEDTKKRDLEETVETVQEEDVPLEEPSQEADPTSTPKKESSPIPEDDTVEL